MIGEIVTHPDYGQGTVVALYRNGEEWMVRFDSGLRFRRPRAEFIGQQDAEQLADSKTLHENAMPYMLDIKPMTPQQFNVRQLVESLRVGVAPPNYVHELTIGLEGEQQRLQQGLTQAHSEGGAACAVLGDYGFGKSHIVELATSEALKRNFLVAGTSLDLQELPPHRAFDIYGSLMRNLRYPDTDEVGLGPLMTQNAVRPQVQSQLRELTTLENDPLALSLTALSNTSSTRQQNAWLNWLSGGRRVKLMTRAKPRGVKFPTIYRQGHNTRQIAYLLSGVSVLARLAGYSGLAVLIDEAECYSLLYRYQQPKADTFFSSVIYTALQERQDQIQEDAFPYHRNAEYPMSYEDRQSLFFLFTVTRSDSGMPLTDWLVEDQIIELDAHHTSQEIGLFLEKIMNYHSQAYDYEVGDRQRQIRRGAAEHLALGMKNDKLSIRSVVRLSVELFDLLFLYPGYEVAVLLDELRNTVR